MFEYKSYQLVEHIRGSWNIDILLSFLDSHPVVEITFRKSDT